MPRWSRIIDAFTSWLFKRLERKPDTGDETTNDIIKFRSRMWCDGKRKDF
jgi:hypothetical protein